MLRLNQLYAKTISGNFYVNNRFPAYCYDKFVCGLIDSHQFVGGPDAFVILEHTTDGALPHLPKAAVEHGVSWRLEPTKRIPGTSPTPFPKIFFWPTSEALVSATNNSAFNILTKPIRRRSPKAATISQDATPTAMSISLCSAMQAYLTAGSEKHLRAAKNGFEMLLAQSFATGASLRNTHSSFETPCGSYARFKLTRYLLRVTRDSRYGDSMERVMYNTILGAKPLLADGSTFYYSDYNFDGKRVYKQAHWPCCSGTMPQVAVDYRINTHFRDAGGVYVNLYIPPPCGGNKMARTFP